MANNSGQRGESEEDASLTPSSEQVREAVHYVRRQTAWTPRVGVILGSGLDPLAEEVGSPDLISYNDIPHFPLATVEGHPGRLAIGEIEKVPVAVMVGRAHFYEGYPMPRVAFPVRVLHGLGCEILIVTNAAGGINPSFRAGDVMLIEDHINLPGLVGLSPILGAHYPELGPRFVSMGQAYDHQLIHIALAASRTVGLELRKGVYAMVGGPAYETQAEVRFLLVIGADAVGMSTAPEVVVARQLQMRVLGLSCIANVASSTGHSELSHHEVLESIGKVVPKLRLLLREFLREWAGPGGLSEPARYGSGRTQRQSDC